MLLAVDVGNTNTVIGVFRGDALVDSWRAETDARRTADEWALLLRGLLSMHGYRVDEIDGMSVACVVPQVTREMRAMGEKLRCVTVFLEPGTRTGIPILIDNPREVGADRVANAVAAAARYPLPAIVVDFGTATNFDVVSARGEYLGGALAPGIEISVDALASRGAQLRKVELVRPRSVIGKSTVEALQSGIVFGFAGQVDGILDRMIAELEASAPGRPVTVVATGGLAPLLVGESRRITHSDPHLTLHGLRLVYAKNVAGS